MVGESLETPPEGFTTGGGVSKDSTRGAPMLGESLDSATYGKTLLGEPLETPPSVDGAPGGVSRHSTMGALRGGVFPIGAAQGTPPMGCASGGV